MTFEQPDFDWYGIVESSDLEQGDFLNDFPILIQPNTLPASIEKLKQLSSEHRIEVGRS